MVIPRLAKPETGSRLVQCQPSSFSWVGRSVSRRMPYKICLAGDPMVGKTSLIRRYVKDEFSDKYLITIGTKVTKKSMDLEAKGARRKFDFLVWDIIGDPMLRPFLKDSYFYGARGVLLVCDVTRRVTLDNLPYWWRTITSVCGPVPTVAVMNKVDLVGQEDFTREDLRARAEPAGWTYLTASAKSGEGVQAAFEFLGRLVVTTRPPRRPSAPS
ncbi:MAG: GTP-binding protein [Methanobacteriota archaeon]|nr:MAG: GTP-binding protein [Euryarchaeota archaeon]